MSMRSSIHKSKPGKPARPSDSAIRRPAGKAGKPVEEYVCDVQCIHPELVDHLEESALDWSKASELSRIFQVMSDPTRLRIISLLAQTELCVCDIAAALNMTQSAVSHQLRVLRISELVKVRKEGRIAWYSLDDDHVLRLFTQGLDHVGHTEQ
jgi:DNA-binding transcriptional ArsR family regulator